MNFSYLNFFFRNYQALYRRATVYLALGQTKKALPDLTNVLSIRTDFDKARTQRGDIYIKQGEYELAEKDLANNAEKRQLIQVCFTTAFPLTIARSFHS